MKEIRHTATFILFIIFNILIISLSLQFDFLENEFRKKSTSDKKQGPDQESFFKEFQFFVNQKNKPFLHLNSEEITVNSTTQKTTMFRVDGEAYTKANKEVKFKGDKGILFQKDNILHLNDNVSLHMENTFGKSDSLIYKMNIDEAELNGEVFTSSYFPKQKDKVEINSDQAIFWTKSSTSKYSGNVVGKIRRSKVYEQNVDFSSQYMDLNMKTGFVGLNEKVSIKKQRLTGTSHRGEIFLENYNKKLKYFALYDDVKVVEKVMLAGKFIERKAFSEKLEGIMSENKIILTGYPKVYQLKDVIKGNRIILREDNEVVEVDDANTNFILK